MTGACTCAAWSLSPSAACSPSACSKPGVAAAGASFVGWEVPVPREGIAMLTFHDSPRRVLIFLFVFATAISAAGTAFAQPQASKAPLADRLPADAILYAGWVGSDRVAELWE